MPKFISVPQGRICRYTSNNESLGASGLYTDNFSSCLIVIIYGMGKQKETKISMIHADETINYNEHIEKEVLWIQGECEQAKKIVIRRPTVSDSMFKNILEEKGFGVLFEKNSEIFAVSVEPTNDQKLISLKTYYRENLPEIVVHPKELSMQAFYMLNLVFDTSELGKSVCRTLFNGLSWNELQKYDCELVSKALLGFNSFKLEKSDPIHIAFTKVRKVVNSKEMALLGTVTMSSLLLLHEHDYISILKVNLKDIADRYDKIIKKSPVVISLKTLSNEIKSSDELGKFINERLNNEDKNYQQLKKELLGIWKHIMRMEIHSPNPKNINSFTPASSKK